jgi:hypothetical protein
MKLSLTISARVVAMIAFAWLTPLGAASAAATRPAYWAPHDEIDYLTNLPRTYSCDDLYYKYRDVLQLVGARPAQIYSYGCAGTHGSATDAPRVDITYSVPSALPTDVHGGSVFQANLATVRLAPGHPKSLDARDCPLLRDMSQTVLASFSAHIDASQLQCGSSDAAHSHFAVIVQTWIPAKPPAS